MKPKIVVIVVTYNGERWLDKCFGSILRSSVPVSVIAVDNASTDHTVARLREDFPCVEIICSKKNLGFGKANNIGIENALQQQASYVFLLNQDAWVKNDTIEKLLELSGKHPEYGIISPVHLNTDGNAFEYKFEEYIQSSVCPGFLSDSFFYSQKELYATTFVNAAAWLIPAAVFRKVGMFDPLFPHYGEDVDFVQRVQFFQYKVGITPLAAIHHDSRVQPWSEIMWNQKRMLTIYLSEVKNINGSLRSNLLIFFKRRFDELTSHLIYRQFRLFRLRLKVTGKTILQLGKVKKARKRSLLPSEYLNP